MNELQQADYSYAFKNAVGDKKKSKIPGQLVARNVIANRMSKMKNIHSVSENL